MADYVDLLIVDGDLVLQNGTERLVDGRDSISQDLRHLVLESGELIALVAERDAGRRQRGINRLIERIEADIRVVPGRVDVVETAPGTFVFSIATVGGNVSITVNNNG